MKKDVIFFSNPFGFGPTCEVAILMNVGKSMWKNTCIHYVASSECTEILSSPGIDIISANQRDPEKIREILSSFDNPYVVSSLNRFAVRIAHEQRYPNCFVDNLTWMWNEIPKEYLLTDIYFALNFPGIDLKIKNQQNVVKIPYIIDSFIAKDYVDNECLVNIGGGMNPLTKKIPTAFLEIVAKAICDLNNKDVVLCGGQESMHYVQKYLPNNKCLTLKKDIFLASLLRTKHFITTPGLNATLEAFYYGIPVSFLMPTNLSHWNILNVLNKQGVVTQKTTWEDILGKPLDLKNTPEKIAIPFLEDIANGILQDKKLLDKAVQMVYNLFQEPKSSEKQKQFITTLGTNGAEVVSKTLMEQWGL